MDDLCGVTVCVDYDDLLTVTLQRNMRHLHKCVVVTSLEDERTARVVREVDGAQLFQTDAFTRYGAVFNKGLAIEEALVAARHTGWTLLWDADILFPEVFEPGRLDQDVLYGAARYQLPEGITDTGGDWSRWEVVASDAPCIGYFQLFHTQARSLKHRPWYPTDSMYAGRSDWGFVLKFNDSRLLPNFEVLHIGRRSENWLGRATPRLDGEPVPGAEQRRIQMGELFLKLGWRERRPDLQELALASRQANGRG